MKGVYLGIDIGSSSVKAIALDAQDGHVRAVGRCQFPVSRPTAGGWEFEPDALYQAAMAALTALPQQDRADARGIGVVGQMCGLVTVDSRHIATGPAIPIFDDRSIPEAQALDREERDHLTAHAANGALATYTLPKLLWLRDHRPEQFDRTALAVLPKDFVRGRLTDSWVTDPSDASGTLAFDQYSGRWDDELLDRLDVRPELWPEVRQPRERAGRLSPEAADATGVPAGIPVAVGASDMAGVAHGVGAESSDEMIVSFGTAAHVIAPVHALEDGIWPIQQYASATGGYFRFGAVYGGSISAQWLLDLLGDRDAFELFGDFTAQPSGSRVFFMPYLSGAGAPHEQPSAAGAFVGLRLGHDRRHLARAVIEGLCFELALICRLHDPSKSRTVHVTGGGARLGPVVQLLADVLGRELHVAGSLESAAVGAALLAAQASDDRELVRPHPRAVVSPRAGDPDDLRDAFAQYVPAALGVRAIGASDASPPSIGSDPAGSASTGGIA